MADYGKIDIEVHKQYAHRVDEFEKWNKDLKMRPSQTQYIAGQTKIIDLAPKYPELTILLQTHQRISWSGVSAPEGFYAQRAGSYRLAPSLGSSERLDADISKIEEVEMTHMDQDLGGQNQEESPDDDLIELEDLIAPLSQQKLSDGQKLAHAVRAIRDTNEMIDYARGRMGQFLQG